METIGQKPEIQLKGLTDEESVEAKADTGAKRTSIDMDLAAEIGAGPVVKTKTFRSASGKEKRPIVLVKIEICGDSKKVAASITDRSELSTPVLLGRDILENFAVTVS